MQLQVISTMLFALAATSNALAIANPEAEISTIEARAGANGNRPIPSGTCCVANTSLKQDACTATNGQAGRCVPGGPGNCNGALNCVAQSSLACDNAVIERGHSLCRFKLANGKLQDGAKQISSLSQAKVN